MHVVPSPASPWSALWRGAVAGLGAVGMLFAAVLPSRVAVALGGWGPPLGRVERALAGALVDLSSVVVLLVPVVALLAFAGPVAWARLRGPRWQRLGALAPAAVLGWPVWTLTVIAQEVKSERGAFPTVFDLLEGGTNASFVGGTLGFLAYERIWKSAAVGLSVAAAVLLWLAVRGRGGPLLPWRGWGVGVVFGLGVGAGVVEGSASALATVNRFGPAALGDPLTGLVESATDLLLRRGPATPRSLVSSAELPLELAATGASRLGWPASGGGCAPHPYARPLDPEREPPGPEPRGLELRLALGRLSSALLRPDDPAVAVFFLSLEGYRADDLHALNAAAARDVAPFTNALYESRRPGVLVSSAMYQAGVRTAHGLGAMLCGVGTLPYNLSFIRDLQPFPVRCASDVLAEAGFEHSFWYGSDASFDEMRTFLAAHGYRRVMSQDELPKELPKGTWDGLTDFAVFDQAVEGVASALAADRAPQFALLMSLSNHSPFTPPEDLPDEVVARVDRSLATVVNRADADDRRRLIAFSYTDAAVQRLLSRLDELGLAERSIVVLTADHSTGHGYVWGPVDPERDAAKAQVPFAVVIPPSFLARARDAAAARRELGEVQRLLDAAPLSLNDVPAMVLALLSAHPSVKALPAEGRWHTLGGQVTSPFFRPGGGPSSYLVGINGVSELFTLDRGGARLGDYEDSVFLKTRADRYRVTPRLIPVTSVLQEVLSCSQLAPSHGARASSFTQTSPAQ